MPPEISPLFLMLYYQRAHEMRQFFPMWKHVRASVLSWNLQMALHVHVLRSYGALDFVLFCISLQISVGAIYIIFMWPVSM
jgi:hypothetical protein